MNGRVVAVLVKPGDRVAAGQPVMTLEAMKMEHVHVAGIAGTVSAIDVAEGEQVTTGEDRGGDRGWIISTSSRASEHLRARPGTQITGVRIERDGATARDRRRNDGGWLPPWRGRQQDLTRPPRPVIQQARDLMSCARIHQQRPLDLAAVHRVAAAGVEGAAGGRVDRARHVAVDQRRQAFRPWDRRPAPRPAAPAYRDGADSRTARACRRSRRCGRDTSPRRGG